MELIEDFIRENKDQFNVFETDEDGKHKPVFSVGKCSALGAKTLQTDSPIFEISENGYKKLSPKKPETKLEIQRNKSEEQQNSKSFAKFKPKKSQII